VGQGHAVAQHHGRAGDGDDGRVDLVHRLRFVAEGGGGRGVVGVTAVLSHPLVGAGGGGQVGAGVRAGAGVVGAVTVDRDLVGGNGGAVQRQGEGDRAGRVIGPGQDGRVVQPGAAARPQGRPDEGEEAGGCGRRLRLVAGCAGGRVVVGVAAVGGDPLVG